MQPPVEGCRSVAGQLQRGICARGSGAFNGSIRVPFADNDPHVKMRLTSRMPNEPDLIGGFEKPIKIVEDDPRWPGMYQPHAAAIAKAHLLLLTTPGRGMLQGWPKRDSISFMASRRQSSRR
jgi:hypothetical protein